MLNVRMLYPEIYVIIRRIKEAEISLTIPNLEAIKIAEIKTN